METQGWLPPPSLTLDEAAMVDRAIEDFRIAMQPATEVDIVRQLMKLSVLLRKPKGFEDNIEEMFDLMVPFFLEYPIDIFMEACKTHVKTSPFFPSVADLMPHLRNGMARRKMMYDKLLQLQRVATNPAPHGLITHSWRLQIITGRQSGNREDLTEYMPDRQVLTRREHLPQQDTQRQEVNKNDKLAHCAQKAFQQARRQTTAHSAKQD